MGETATVLRAGVYGRESKGKQKSVDDQVTLGLRVIEDRPEWTHAGTYDDGSSASRFATKARADWERLAADLKQHKLDILIVWEITRGSREPVEGFTWLNLCRDNGVLIYVMSDEELYDPRKTRHYDALGRAILDGAKESNTTSDRVLRGVRAAAANPEGATPHGRVPYGYVRQLRNPALVVRPDNTPWEEFYLQTPGPETAPIVREIFRRIGRSDPIVHIVNDLNSRGVPSPSGGAWNRQTIRKMIRNVAYTGKRQHGGKLYNAVWPELVSESEFRSANRVLDTPGRRRTKPGLAKWLLAYIALSNCGSPMHGMLPRDGRKAKYHCLKDGCTSVGQWELDEYVTRLVVGRFSKPDARDLFVADDSEASRAADEAAELRAKLEEARASFAQPDGISAASLAFTERQLQPLIEDAERRKVSASVPAAVAELVTADDVRKAWDGLPLAGQREVVQMLFTEIRVGKPGSIRLGWWSDDEDRLQAAADRTEITWT